MLSANETMLVTLFLYQLLITQLDADVACAVLDYAYYTLIGMVKAQYYRCLPFSRDLTSRSFRMERNDWIKLS